MNKENFILTPNSYTQEEWCEMYAKMVKYAQKLNNAIKEVREYIKANEFYLDYKTGACIKGVIPLLEILDKAHKEESK